MLSNHCLLSDMRDPESGAIDGATSSSEDDVGDAPSDGSVLDAIKAIAAGATVTLVDETDDEYESTPSLHVAVAWISVLSCILCVRCE